MKLLDDLCKETTNKQVDKAIDKQTSVITNGAKNYNNFKDKFIDHKLAIVEVKKEASKILPWVHIAISNAKKTAVKHTSFHWESIYKAISMNIATSSISIEDILIPYLIEF